jgi:hypothetical protein
VNFFLLGLLVVLGLLLPPTAEAARALRFDPEPARATWTALDDPALTAEAAWSVARLPGKAAPIRQAARFDPLASEARFVQELLAAARGQPGPDGGERVRFGQVKRDSERLRKLVQVVLADPAAIARAVAQRDYAFAAAGLRMDVLAVLVAGGSSDGWAPTPVLGEQGQPRSYFTAVHFFNSDLEGLKLLMAHERYHRVQAEAQRPAAGTPTPNAADRRAGQGARP